MKTIKSVIKKQAIEFCEWLRKENWGETSGLTPTLWEHNRTGELSTTEMLYKKFIKSYENKRVKVIIKDQVV